MYFSKSPFTNNEVQKSTTGTSTCSIIIHQAVNVAKFTEKNLIKSSREIPQKKKKDNISYFKLYGHIPLCAI